MDLGKKIREIEVVEKPSIPANVPVEPSPKREPVPV